MFVTIWTDEVAAAGLPGIHLVGVSLDPLWDPRVDGYDAAVLWTHALFATKVHKPVRRLRRAMQRSRLIAAADSRLRRTPLHVYSYDAVAPHFVDTTNLSYEHYPSVLPNWDNTPRAGLAGSVLTGASPQAFQSVLTRAVAEVQALPPDHRLVFVRSWNEWAEGNYLEPDRIHGRAWLRACQAAVQYQPSATADHGASQDQRSAAHVGADPQRLLRPLRRA
jgi:hypothetical protein